MKTIIVWVLYINVFNYGNIDNTVIDNIATRQNCEALGSQIISDIPGTRISTRCIAVRKIVP